MGIHCEINVSAREMLFFRYLLKYCSGLHINILCELFTDVRQHCHTRKRRNHGRETDSLIFERLV